MLEQLLDRIVHSSFPPTRAALILHTLQKGCGETFFFKKRASTYRYDQGHKKSLHRIGKLPGYTPH